MDGNILRIEFIRDKYVEIDVHDNFFINKILSFIFYYTKNTDREEFPWLALFEYRKCKVEVENL